MSSTATTNSTAGNNITTQLQPARGLRRSRFAGRRALSDRERSEAERAGILSSAPVIKFDRSGRSEARKVALKQFETTPETALSPAMMRRAFAEIARGMPATCVSRLRAELNRFGIMFVLGDDELIPTAELRRYVQCRLRPLQDDAMIAFLCIGVVPIAFERNPDTDEVLPYVPPPGSYNITVQTLRGRREYRFYWAAMSHIDGDNAVVGAYTKEQDRSTRPGQARYVARGYRDPAYAATSDSVAFGRYDPSVVVINNLGAEPALNGRLHSLMASIISDYIDFQRALRSDAIAANYVNARPPLITERDPAYDRARQNSKGDELGYFVGSDVLQETEGGGAERHSKTYEMTGRRREAQMANYRLLAAQHGEEYVKDVYGVDASVYRAADPTSLKYNDELARDEIEIAEGRRVASSAQRAAPPPDAYRGIEHNDERISWAFGIPMQVFTGASNVTAGAEVANKTLNSTVHDMQAKLSDILTITYDHVFLYRDIFAALCDTSAASGQGKPLLSEADLFSDSLAEAQVRVTFRYTPAMDVGDLKYMYGRGMISWDTFAYNYLQITGLEPTNLANPNDPLPTEAGRTVDLPEYHKYAQLQQQAKQADAALKSAERQSALQAKTAIAAAKQQQDAQTADTATAGGKRTAADATAPQSKRDKTAAAGSKRKAAADESAPKSKRGK